MNLTARAPRSHVTARSSPQQASTWMRDGGWMGRHIVLPMLGVGLAFVMLSSALIDHVASALAYRNQPPATLIGGDRVTPLTVLVPIQGQP